MAKHTTAAPELFRRSPGPEPEKPKDMGITYLTTSEAANEL